MARSKLRSARLSSDLGNFWSSLSVCQAGWVAQVFQDETRHSIPPKSVFEGSDLSPTGGGFRFGRDGSILVGLVGFVRSTVCMDNPNSNNMWSLLSI